jgi:hypothetical protein
MTDQMQKNLSSYSASILKETGIYYPESDPLLPALYILHKETQLNIQANKEMTSLVREALSKINPKEFKFYSEEAAWQFQLGITFRRVLLGILVLFSVWGLVLLWPRVKPLVQTRSNKLLERMQQDRNGRYYIDFTAAKGNAASDFEEFNMIDSKTVRVYPGKDAK